MPQQTEQIKTLFEKYIQQTSSQQEEQELADLVEQYSNDELADMLEPIAATTKADPQFKLQDWEQVIQSIIQHPAAKENKSAIIRRINPIAIGWYKRIAVAASILLVVSLGLYFIIARNDAGVTKQSLTKIKDIEAPKVTKATITLADGRTISIDSLTTLTQNNVTILKSADGKIIYTGTANEVVYNTLSNPRGSKVIDMTLSDGSKVWLNAGSSVTYPIAFIGNERKVTITGEAYFEVAQDKTKPFFVSKGDVRVQVLGTHFNVNAYDDESTIKVTLLEGSVSVKLEAGNQKSEVVLKPGDQAQVGNGIVVKKGIDVEEVMAWKDGRFQFNGAGLEDMMRQIARWYDVKIIYETQAKDLHFTGGISRDVEASKVFKMLETTEAVHFRIEGKRIFVMK